MALRKMEEDPQREGPRPDIQAQVAALLDVLNEDIRHVEAALVRLDTLRKLLIKRDEGALAKLLEEIRGQGETYVATERKRQELRQDLASGLGWKEKEVTLTNLLSHVTGDLGTTLAQQQAKLKDLIVRLKREHTLTAMLILDCRRFNRSLLQVFLGPAGKTGTTYSPTGAAKHPTGMALLNMQF
jgi:hypothetical protein